MLQTKIHNHSIQAPPPSWSGQASKKTPVANTATPSRPYESRITVPAGEPIFAEGDAAIYFYKLMTGSVRLVKTMANGHRQICDFHLPGDLIGVSNALEHDFSAEAIQ